MPADLIPPDPPPVQVGLALGAGRAATGGSPLDAVLLGARLRRGVLGVELAGLVNPSPSAVAPVDESIAMVMHVASGDPWAATTRAWAVRATAEVGPAGAVEPADAALADWDAGRRPWGGPRLLLGGEVRGLQAWSLSSPDGETIEATDAGRSVTAGPVIGAALAVGYGDIGALRFAVLDGVTLPTGGAGLEHAWSLELGLELGWVRR